MLRLRSRTLLNSNQYKRSFSVFKPARTLKHDANSTAARLKFDSEIKKKIANGPTLKDFIQGKNEASSHISTDIPEIPYLTKDMVNQIGKKMYIETYGCQMNVSDQEIIVSIMKKAGFDSTDHLEEADVVFLNTCAIRERAEQKIWDRLDYLKSLKKKKKREMMVGVLGCMAERLKTKLIEADKMVDIVVGPDAYRDLPRLVSQVDSGSDPAVNVLLSLDETYADITPVRTSTNGVSAYVSIMRGCNNMCSYCIVPFTRGRERSRSVTSIEDEIRQLSDQGFKEVTLLGQNVNSYNYTDDESVDPSKTLNMTPGFTSIYKTKKVGTRFSELIDRVSRIDPEMRIRFTSPHPKDFPDDLLTLIKERPNLCNSLHVPAQSGSSQVLERMRRGYTREAYIELIDKIKQVIPNCGISSDFISGFCGETEAEHQETISLLNYVKYSQAFMYAYSLREKTHAHRHYQDDVPEDIKQRRLREVIDTFTKNLAERSAVEVGKTVLVLVEGFSKKSKKDLSGRSDNNRTVIFPDQPTPSSLRDSKSSLINLKPGEYVAVKINEVLTHSLRGTPIGRTTITEFETYQRMQ